jgi:DNA invertase Pin-like site-specific DNA recombinase
MEGIAKAKAAGVYKGRPPSIDPAVVKRLKEEGTRPTEIAKELGIGRASVYRLLGVKPITPTPTPRTRRTASSVRIVG